MAQDDLFSKLPQGEFDGITIPVLGVKIKTGSAAALHRYPYRAGVDIEYTGRDPLTGTITAAYFNGLGTRTQDDLWPGALFQLRRRIQEPRSGKLVIPVLGTLPKAKLELDEDYDPRKRDGAYVTIHFTEDSKDYFSIKDIPAPATKAAAAAARADTALAKLGLAADLPLLEVTGFARADLSSSDVVTSTDFATFLSGALFALQQSRESIENIRFRFERIIDRCQELMTTVASFNDPENWEAVRAFRSLEAQASILKNTLGIGQVVLYVVAATMPLAVVSVATRNSVEELLSLNPAEAADPLSIDVGTQLFVYDRAA